MIVQGQGLQSINAQTWSKWNLEEDSKGARAGGSPMPSDTWSFVQTAGSPEEARVHHPGLCSQALVHVCTHILLATRSEHAHSHTQVTPSTLSWMGVPTLTLQESRGNRSKERLLQILVTACKGREGCIRTRKRERGPAIFNAKDSRRHSWVTHTHTSFICSAFYF